jgi:hypothetical protein
MINVVTRLRFFALFLTLSGFRNLTGFDTAAAATVVLSRPILFRENYCQFLFFFLFRKEKLAEVLLRNPRIESRRYRAGFG